MAPTHRRSGAAKLHTCSASRERTSVFTSSGRPAKGERVTTLEALTLIGAAPASRASASVATQLPVAKVPQLQSHLRVRAERRRSPRGAQRSPAKLRFATTYATQAVRRRSVSMWQAGEVVGSYGRVRAAPAASRGRLVALRSVAVVLPDALQHRATNSNTRNHRATRHTLWCHFWAAFWSAPHRRCFARVVYYVVRSVVRFSSAPLALHPSCALCAGMDLDALLAGEADAEELSGALEPKLSRALLGLSDACTQTTSLIAWRSQQRHRQTRCWTRSQRRASYRRRLTQCTRDSRGLQHRRAAEAQAGHGRSDRRVSIAQRRDAFRSDCPPHSSEATLLAGAGAEHRHTHL